MKRLRVVSDSRIDAGVRLQMILAAACIQGVEKGRVTDNEEALAAIARSIAYLVNAERYIRDPKGVWV